jgi:hypothetical protein
VTNESLQQATVRIWIGSEWAPLRDVFTTYLGNLWSPTPATLVVATESVDPERMAGRVAGWVRKMSPAGDTETTVLEPGGDFDLQSDERRTLIGVTELLLDPDPNQVDQLYAVGLWSRFVPRNRKLLMRVTPFLDEEIVENAAIAAPRLLLQLAEWNGQRVLIASTDLIAAEVVARGLRAIAQPAGDVGLNPWQTDLVRIASERGLGVVTGPRIELEIHRAGPMPPPVAAAFREIAGQVGKLVDCPVSFHG